MSDFAQYAALGRALARTPVQRTPQPQTIPGLEALGRSSHGGAPITGSVYHDPLAEERAMLSTAAPLQATDVDTLA